MPGSPFSRFWRQIVTVRFLQRAFGRIRYVYLRRADVAANPGRLMTTTKAYYRGLIDIAGARAMRRQAPSDRRPSCEHPEHAVARRELPAVSIIHELRRNLHFVDKTPAPSLLPILRSQQQAEILALLLGDPELEISLTEIASRTGAPHPSVHREVQRAEEAGLVKSRKVGNTRLVRANTDSPYFSGLAEVLTRAFGIPAVLSELIRDIRGVRDAYVYGSWSARRAGRRGVRPVGDIDLLVLGEPDRDKLYEVLGKAERLLGRSVQVTIRDADWLESGSGSFHRTVTGRPLVRLALENT